MGEIVRTSIPSGCRATRCRHAEPEELSTSLKLVKSNLIVRKSPVALSEKPVRRASTQLKRGEPSGTAG